MANSSSNADLVWRKYNRQVPAGTAGAHRKRQYTALWDKLTEDEQKEVAVAITQANYAHKWVLYELYKYSKVKRCQVLEPWIIQVGNNDTTARTVERLIRARIKYLQMAGDLLVLLQGIGAGVAVQRVEYDRMAQHVGAIRMEQDVVASIVAPTDASTPQRQLDIINIQEETSRLKKAGWEGNYHHIKTGGQGQVGLWVRKENGRITDRVVVKDNHYSKPDDRRLWTSHLTWTGNLDDLVYRKPIEVEAMERLQATGADCILRLRGKWRVFEEKMLYKIYTEYCPYGTLRDLINDEAAEGEDYPANEPLAWWIFKNLGDMGLLMEQGDLETPVPGWKQIVHSDIKPDNILLTDRSGDGDIDFPLYKQPVLDDFGLAVFTSPNDPHNPDDYTDRGTPSFKAPEQCATRGDEGEEERVEVEKLGAKTNVWGVGITIMAYMTRYTDPGNLSFTEGDQTPEWNDFARAGFSKTLRKLVMRCMQYKQEDRITFQELRDLIDQHTSGREGMTDFSEGMRTHKNAATNQYPMFPMAPTDRYPIG